MPSLSPKAAGAETALDVGVFCLGAAAGGLVDALLNSFGFADPLVVASLGGTGALGLKKSLWDSWLAMRRRSGRNGYRSLRAEADIMEALGSGAEADFLRFLVERGEQARADPDVIRKHFEERRPRP